MFTDFLSRLQRVIDDRKPFSWAQSMGWNKSTMTQVKRGHIPGPDLLIPVCWAENARLDWLLTGRGTPYFATACPDDSTALQMLTWHLEDSADWKIHVLTAPRGFALCLTMPAEIDNKGSTVKYTALEVMVGNLGPAVRQHVFRQVLAGRTVRVTSITEDVWFQLQLGEIGSYQLLNSDDAILKYGVTVIDDKATGQGAETFDWESLKVAEPIAQYDANQGSGKLRITGHGKQLELMQRIERLDRDDRAILERLLARLSGDGNM